jgi:hypothetical protein
MKTISIVRSERRSVVLNLFIMFTSYDGARLKSWQVVTGENKKDLYPGFVAWIKVLLTGFCPSPGSFDRLDGYRVGLFGGR